MRIDTERYRKKACPKCPKFTGDKPVFGKCMGSFDDIYECVRRKLFGQGIEARREETTKEGRGGGID